MSSHTLRALIAMSGMLAVLLPTPAEAQIVRRYRGGAIHVRAPFVRVNVGPHGETSVRAPFVAVDPGGVRVGIHRRHEPMPQYLAPPYGQPAPFPTEEELASMNEATLFTALHKLAHALDTRLSQFRTGASWRRYLRIPEIALKAPAANLDKLGQMLARFESVAANKEYVRIAGLPSFVATRAALQQVVGRLSEQQTGEPADSGSSAVAPAEDKVPATPAPTAKPAPLAKPAPAAEPEKPQGERSILK